MQHEELLRLTGEYFERTRKERIGMHEPNEKGLWEVVGGILTSDGERKSIAHNLVSGKFSDAVAYAVQQMDFYPYGLIRKCNIVPLPDFKIPNSLLREVPIADYQD